VKNVRKLFSKQESKNIFTQLLNTKYLTVLNTRMLSVFTIFQYDGLVYSSYILWLFNTSAFLNVGILQSFTNDVVQLDPVIP